MAAPLFQDLARVRIIGEIHGSQTVNVMHFAKTNVDVDLPTLLGKLQVLAQNIVQCVVTALLPVVTSDWRILRVEAQGVSPVVTDPEVAQAPLPNQGGDGSQGVTIAASLIHMRTGGGGRRGRGRMFLPPSSEARIALGEWDATWLAALTAFAVCLAEKYGEPGGTEEWRLGVLSRKNFSAVGGTVANSFRPATQLAPQQVAASMRTRKKGRGA